MREIGSNMWVLLLLFALHINGQTNNIHVRESASGCKASEKTTKEKQQVYTFKSFKHKELIVKAAYKNITGKLIDKNYPKEKLEQEKKEFICLLKGKVEEDGNT